jgi:hypothetical protein
MRVYWSKIQHKSSRNLGCTLKSRLFKTGQSYQKYDKTEMIRQVFVLSGEKLQQIFLMLAATEKF